MTVGFLDIDDHARPGPALARWPDPDHVAVHRMWLAALPAAIAAITRDVDEADASICARVLLTALAADPDAAPDALRWYGREAVGDEYSEAVFRFFTSWYRLTSPIPVALESLAELGAVHLRETGRVLTLLGSWALDELLARAHRAS